MVSGDIGQTTLITATLFSTALAPIAGEYGKIIGIGAGMLHIFLVINLAPFHGGLLLYNNGFAAGIIATVFVPMVTAFKKGETV